LGKLSWRLLVENNVIVYSVQKNQSFNKTLLLLETEKIRYVFEEKRIQLLGKQKTKVRYCGALE
jgi:hypothetical protein